MRLSLAALLVCSTALGGELVVATCDSPASVSLYNGASAAAADHSGDPAIELTLSDGNDLAYINIPNGAQWPSYDGVRFWVRSDTITWTTIGIIYSGSYLRFYAGFPVTPTWAEITIPWREFTQRNYEGPIESHLSEVHTFDFSIKPTITKDNQPRTNFVFEIDNIRVVDGLSPSPTPTPSSVDLPRTKAKIAASQHVNIVCLGTSITYGLKLADRTTQAYSPLLESSLRADLGYSDLDVVNFGLPGACSWWAACNIPHFLGPENPDLVIVEFLYNDAWETYSDPANYRDNINRLLDILLRWDQADVLVMFPTPHAESGNTHAMDTWEAELEAAAAERNLATADVYHDFLSLSEGELIALYAASDFAHPNAAGHQRIAQVLHDALMGYLPDIEPPQVDLTECILSGTADDLVSPPAIVTVVGVGPFPVTSTAWTTDWLAVGSSPKTFTIQAEDASSNQTNVQVTLTW